jgi:hypothetical protein
MRQTTFAIVGRWSWLVFLPILAGLAGQQSGSTPDVSRLGPQVGDRVPAFTLPDQDGRLWSLRDLMGPKGLMLVFNRSADW